jgi:hypothetical protein
MFTAASIRRSQAAEKLTQPKNLEVNASAVNQHLSDEHSTIENIARKEKPSKSERKKLYTAFTKEFPVTENVKRRNIESWIDDITHTTVDYIINRRNTEAGRNLSMHDASKMSQHKP